MDPKEIRKLLNRNLEWFLEKNFLTKSDLQLEYLKCLNELVQFSARIFYVKIMVVINKVSNKLIIVVIPDTV